MSIPSTEFESASGSAVKSTTIESFIGARFRAYLTKEY